MKKEHIYKFLYFISMILIIGFCIRLAVDYFKYDIYNNSAPFYVFAIIRIFEFLLPSVLFLIAGKLIKIKYNTNKN